MEREILHIDMDAFFASVETLDNPALRGQPVIVAGRAENRGVVCAASYEARRYGVHSAMSTARARQLCPRGVFIEPSRFRYGQVSREVFAIFAQYTPLIEGISVDEAFLDVTASRRLFGPGEAIGREIQRRIRDEIGITCSVGLASNKFLAKIASDLEKPEGFVVIRAAEAAARLAPLGVGRIWGVGKAAEIALRRIGIERVGDLEQFSVEDLRPAIGEFAAGLKRLALGLDDRPVVVSAPVKSVSNETTFPRDIACADELRLVCDRLADKVARRLRAQHLRGQTIQIKARYPDFTTHTRAMKLERPTGRTDVIQRTARDLLERRLGRGGRPLRLVGVGVSQLSADGEALQMDFFGEREDMRPSVIDQTLDAMREKYGSGALIRGNLAWGTPKGRGEG